MQKMTKLFLIICIALGVLVPFIMVGSTLAAQKAPYGELVVARSDLHTENFDPDELGSLLWYASINEFLFTLEYKDGKTSYTPGLVERWDVSDDGLTWDFYIRKGVQWHKGYGEFTAEDILFTWKYLSREGTHFPSAWLWLPPEKQGICKSIKIIDKYHIRQELTKPYSWLEFVYARDIYMISKKYFEEVGRDKAIKDPIGTGPWEFVSIKPAEEVRFKAVENHYRKTPEFKYLTIKALPSAATRMAMLKTGDVDLALISAKKISEVEAAGLHTKRLDAIGAYTAVFGGQFGPDNKNFDPTSPWAWHQDEPLDSEWNQRALKVRKALCLAINKKAIIDMVFDGEAVETPLYGWQLGTELSRPEWKPYPYDLKQAKALLKEAGYPKGFGRPVTFYVYESSYAPMAKPVIMAVANDLQALGIKLDMKVIDFMTFIDIWPLKKENAWSIGVSAGYGAAEPVWQLQYVYPSWAFFADGAFSHPDFDNLYDKAMYQPDPQKRIKASHDIGDYIIKNYISGGICLPNWIVAMSKKTGPADKWYHDPKTTSLGSFEYVPHAE